MNNKLFVGNLPYSVDANALRELFSAIDGVEVTDAIVISDKFTGRSKGFGFVTLANDEQAQKAIEAKNGNEFDGRAIVVNVAKPLEKREDRNFNR